LVDTIPGLKAAEAAAVAGGLEERVAREEAEAECGKLTALLNERIEAVRLGKERLSTLEATLAERDATIASDTGEIMQLTGHVETLRGDLALERESCSTLRGALSGSEKTVEGLQRELEHLKAQLEEARQRGEMLGNTVHELQGHVEEEERAVADLASKMEKTHGQVSFCTAQHSTAHTRTICSHAHTHTGFPLPLSQQPPP